MKSFHWLKIDYFPYFIETNQKSAILALEYLGKWHSIDFQILEKKKNAFIRQYSNICYSTSSRRSTCQQRGDNPKAARPLWFRGLFVGHRATHVVGELTRERQLGLRVRHDCRDERWHRAHTRLAHQSFASRRRAHSALSHSATQD